MASTLDAFALAPSSSNRGLVRRLMDGTLRPPEQQYLDTVERIASLEDEGLKYPRIAESLGLKPEKLGQLVRSAKYRIFRKYVADRAVLQTDQSAVDRRRQERRRWESNYAKSLDYYDVAFRKHTQDDDVEKGKKPRFKKGDFVDLDRAERAAKMCAESAGWTEPVAATMKPKELKVGVIQQAMTAMQATDRRETVVRIVTTETIEVGQRETQSLGGEA